MENYLSIIDHFTFPYTNPPALQPPKKESRKILRLYIGSLMVMPDHEAVSSFTCCK